MKYFFLFLFITITSSIYSQDHVSIDTIRPNKEYDNILVRKISSDNHQSAFVIWVKQNVKEHKHEKHTETLYFIEGSCKMKVDGKIIELKAGDFLTIPEGIAHSVEKVTSKTPLKVLSTQAPEFKGEDRVFIEK